MGPMLFILILLPNALGDGCVLGILCKSNVCKLSLSSVEKCLPNAFRVLRCFKELCGRWPGSTGKHGAFGARHLGPGLDASPV